MRTFIYTAGFVLAGMWHLRFPPRDGHLPKSWFEVYKRVVIGIFWVLFGMGSLILLLDAYGEAQVVPPVTLNWQDNSGFDPKVDDQETKFNVERQLNGGPFGKIGQTLANVTTYVDSTRIQSIGSANTYCYRVNAENAAGASAYTEVGCALTLPAIPLPKVPPKAPTGLTAKPGP